MHTFPQLRKIERKYGDQVIVVGVHSPKFPAERETANLREAVLRYRIEHSEVNDRDFAVWERFGGRAWPTLMFIDPEGRVIGKHEGELPFEQFDPLVSGMLKEFEDRGLLHAGPSTIALEEIREPARAAFQQPQGMARSGSTLYVADTENHAIRSIDLESGIATTLAGTGEQALRPGMGGPGRSTPLSSPWDLALDDRILYIAMAGTHQIWTLDLDRDTVAPFAGTGREGLLDGAKAEAWFAQSSGLTILNGHLYVADSEVSAVRDIDLESGVVTTLVGEDLFVFGDQDGEAEVVRLQHPLGITGHHGILFVADSYNNKVKRLDPERRAVATWLGSGIAGRADGPGQAAAFREPGGICAGVDGLYVADTNNHRIV